jgi:hypothetical protein
LTWGHFRKEVHPRQQAHNPIQRASTGLRPLRQVIDAPWFAGQEVGDAKRDDNGKRPRDTVAADQAVQRLELLG